MQEFIAGLALGSLGMSISIYFGLVYLGVIKQ